MIVNSTLIGDKIEQFIIKMRLKKNIIHFVEKTKFEKAPVSRFSNCNELIIIENNNLLIDKDKYQVGGQAVLGRQLIKATPWLTKRHG